MENDKKNITLSYVAKNWLLPVFVGSLIALPIIMSFNKIEEKQESSDSYDFSSSSSFSSPTSLIKNKKNEATQACSLGRKLEQCFKPKEALCEADMKVAKTAWKYFENNYQEKTGLFNAANNYASTTMWDTGSALAATLAAEDFGLISTKEFDDKITALIKTLVTMGLFNKEAPNKVYNTKTMKMVTYGNKVTPDGIGVSVLDMARLISWLNTLSCKHPKFKHQIDLAVKRWNFDRLIQNGRMMSLKRDLLLKNIHLFMC